ncbi:SDR family oxidoreductase [Luteibacter yeojuensis]|uniref:SDR family oxidoreductase n=1 Tax=Luteibacter yeojuensis TaxID=345309 RepID=A0A7X5QSC3_9GAMM|nr:SDR family oxidoreductase [Luteibacter yeojuensis]
MSEQGHVVLITGGSRGIGRATAELAASRGWKVGINYQRDAGAAGEAVATIQRAGGQALAIQGDVAIEGDVIGMFDRLAEAFGPVTALVNNAGIVAPASLLADMDVSRMRRVFDTNILGAYLSAREAARRLSTDRGGPGGAIVNVSSIASRIGSANEYVDYAGSKGAVDTLTLGLAQELAGRGVRVNCVRPGIIDTEIHASGGQPDRAWQRAGVIPLQRPGQASEVAAAIVWLLSDEASYTTGAILDVAGGR